MTIFERIIKKEIPAKIIYEDQRVIAIYDIKPLRPGHFLVIPKKHSVNLFDIDDQELSYLIKKARALALIEVKKQKVNGFNLIINNGKEAGQEVFHTHIHIVPSAN